MICEIYLLTDIQAMSDRRYLHLVDRIVGDLSDQTPLLPSRHPWPVTYADLEHDFHMTQCLLFPAVHVLHEGDSLCSTDTWIYDVENEQVNDFHYMLDGRRQSADATVRGKTTIQGDALLHHAKKEGASRSAPQVRCGR